METGDIVQRPEGHKALSHVHTWGEGTESTVYEMGCLGLGVLNRSPVWLECTKGQ